MIRVNLIIGAVLVDRFSDKAREPRLRWFGHVKRRDMCGGGCSKWTRLGRRREEDRRKR